MFARIKRAYKAFTHSPSRKMTAIESLFGGLFGEVIETSKLTGIESYLKAGTQKIWALWKGCHVVANVAMATDHKLFRKGSEESITHPDIEALLSVPNEHTTFGEMIYKTVFHLKLTGNAFWVKDQVTMDGNRPKRLFMLNPKRVRIHVDSKKGLVGFTYCGPGGLWIPFDPSEVMHFRIPHADNDWWGLGEVEAGEPLFQQFINRQTWETKFWKNGAAPSGILTTTEQIRDEDEFLKLKEKFRSQYGGVDNAGKIAIMTGEWNYQQLGLTMQEMQDIEANKLSVDHIFIMLGVPPSVAGIEKAANRATAEMDDIRFRRDTVMPLLKLIEETMNSDLITGFDSRLDFRFQMGNLVDIEPVTRNWTPWFDRGVVSINEVREMLGLDKIGDPLYDQHFINAGLLPLELAGLSDFGQTDDAARAIVSRFTQQTFLTPTNGSDRDTRTAIPDKVNLNGNGE